MPKKIVAIDSQKLDAMQLCGFFYDTKFGENLVPREVATYLERGSLVHKMLETYYKLKNYRSRWYQNNKNYADIIESCVTVGKHFGNRMQLDIDEVLYTIDVFRQYAAFWENDDWNDIRAVESVGSKILYDDEKITILYEVKIDLIIRSAGMILPVDHKHSASRRDPNELANQFKGYCWFLGSNNMVVNEIGFQKTIPPKDKFRRHVMSFSDAIIEEWRQNTISTVRLKISLDEAGIKMKNFTSCYKYSGCELRHVCIADPGEFRDFKLKRDFVERIWDVGAQHL